MIDIFHDMIGLEVEVKVNQETYKGKLVSSGARFIVIQSKGILSRTIIYCDKITSLRCIEDGK